MLSFNFDIKTYNKKPQSWFKVFVFSAAFLFSACNLPVVDNKDVKRAKNLPKLPYTSLTTEETHSFFRGGSIPDESHKAMTTFVSVTDCLLDSEKVSKEVDLRLINWRKIKSRDDLNICLWRIFSSLEHHQIIFDWLAFHGLVNGGTDRKSGRNPADLESYKTPYIVTKPDGRQVHHRYFTWFDSVPFKDEDRLPLSTGLTIKVQFEKDSGEFLGARSRWRPVL